MKIVPYIPEEDGKWYKSLKSNNRRKELPMLATVHYCKLMNFLANPTNSCLMVLREKLETAKQHDEDSESDRDILAKAQEKMAEEAVLVHKC
jgi:hypothetical protein